MRRIAIGIGLMILMVPTVGHAGVKGELGSMSGTVVNESTGAPIAGMCVQATFTLESDGRQTSSRRQYKTTTNSAGEYQLENMKPGQYLVVFLSCKDNKPKTQEFAPSTFRDKLGLAPVQPPLVTPGPISPYAELVRILVGLPTTEIDAGMSPGATVTGRVVDPAGRPLKDMCVQTRFDLASPQSAIQRTNDAGRFELQGVLPRDPDTATEGFEVLLEFSDCSRSPKYSTSSISVSFPGPREGVTIDDYTMQEDTASCVPPGRAIRSVDGIAESTIRFVMDASGTADVFWLDYSGARVLYITLSEGQSIEQPTFITHPWVVVNSDGECLGYILSNKPLQSLRIR